MTHFETLKNKVTHQYITGDNREENDIFKLYYIVLEKCVLSYSEYRNLAPRIIALEEETEETFMVYQLTYFVNNLSRVIKKRSYERFDLSDLHRPFNESSYQEFIKRFKTKLSLSNQFRLSTFDFDLEGFSKENALGIANYMIGELQIQISSDDIMTAEEGETLWILLTQIKILLKKADKNYHFYYLIGMYFDKLFRSEFNQQTRDLAEEIVLCSFADNHKTLGFLNSFKCYSNQGNRPASLFYANLSLTNILINSEQVSEKYLENFLWQAIKFFRNINFYDLTERMYNQIPLDLHILPYNRRAIDNSYFASLLSRKQADLPTRFLDYLNKNREDILNDRTVEGTIKVTPWLIILYNIRKIYPEINFQSMFGFYLTVFESIALPTPDVQRYKSIIEGEHKVGLQSLKTSIKKLTASRDYQDVQYDIERAVFTASRIIEDAVNNENVEALLLSMFMKTDFALSFEERYSSDFIKFELPDTEDITFNSLYENKTALAATLKSSEEIIWLMCTEEKMFQMSFIEEKFHFFQLTHWVKKDFQNLLEEKMFLNISFDETVKDRLGFRASTKEEYLEQEKELKQSLSFAKINFDERNEAVLLVKDRGVVAYPHNLLLNQNGDFVHKNRPITDILTTEWFINNKSIKTLTANKTKSIWIPTSGGDFTINMLLGKLEKFLQKEEFDIFTDLKIKKALNSNINIVCMHGANDISSKKVLYPNDSYINERGRVGEGTVLILLVCYSGSYKNEFNKNNVSSLVKTYIQRGYQAVVAPFWRLHIEIPPIWLPAFLNALDSGCKIDDAVFKANKEVYNKYPTPAAWAAMHLYGNPNVRFRTKNV